MSKDRKIHPNGQTVREREIEDERGERKREGEKEGQQLLDEKEIELTSQMKIDSVRTKCAIPMGPAESDMGTIDFDLFSAGK